MSQTVAFGANCLTSLFLRESTLVDAHRVALDSLLAAGLRLTEISQPGLLTLHDAAEVRRHADELGIKVCAVHAPPLRRDPTLARQRHAALLAAALGARVLVIHVSSLRFADPDPPVRAQARDRDLRHLETLAAFCDPLNVAIGLENGKLAGHADYLHGLLDTLDGRTTEQGEEPTGPTRPRDAAADYSFPSLSPLRLDSSQRAGLVFDSGHAALRGGDPVAVAERMLPRLIHTHLHDNHGTRDEHLPPGDGHIPWQALLDRLSTGHYTGALLLELHPRSVGDAARWYQALARGQKVLSAAADRTKGGGETPV